MRDHQIPSPAKENNFMKAVIIDDEKDSRDVLAGYLGKYCPQVRVAGFGESVATGLEAIAIHQPDVVFLDIEMPYGNGFDLLSQVPDPAFETIFVTAFDNYAIQALNQSAAYYLLKPIDIDELVKAIEKVEKEWHSGARRHASVLVNNIRSDSIQKIMLPTLEGFEVVRISSITYCEAVDNFTRFHFDPDDRMDSLLICRTLKYFEDVLRVHRFARVHRSFLINPDFVIRYTKGKGGTVTMKGNAEVEVSAARKEELLKLFER